MSDRTGLNRRLFWLYEGIGHVPGAFRWGLLIFDALALGYFLVTLFEAPNVSHGGIDLAIGIVIAIDLLARFWIDRARGRFFLRPMNIADLVVVLTLVAPLMTQDYVFLRILRAVRLARAYSFLSRASRVSQYLRDHHDVIDRVVNLVVFIFVMTALVHADQAARNENIASYVDALYFTVSSLTTTGYGDILMVGWTGRLLSTAIMLLGVTLFLRLLSALFRPGGKIDAECETCGLARHDRDAVHCKHCGAVMHIETQGDG